MLDIKQQITNSITITPYNILDALKNNKCGKLSDVDGISTKHFVNADSRIHVLYHCYFRLLLHMVTCQAS